MAHLFETTADPKAVEKLVAQIFTKIPTYPHCMRRVLPATLNNETDPVIVRISPISHLGIPAGASRLEMDLDLQIRRSVPANPINVSKISYLFSDPLSAVLPISALGLHQATVFLWTGITTNPETGAFIDPPTIEFEVLQSGKTIGAWDNLGDCPSPSASINSWAIQFR